MGSQPAEDITRLLRELTGGNRAALDQLLPLLYELLTGRRPYALSGQAWHEISRAVCETMPAPPSQVVWNTSGALMVNGASASVETISNARKHTPTSLGAMLAGSLDNVVMKALRPAGTLRDGCRTQRRPRALVARR